MQKWRNISIGFVALLLALSALTPVMADYSETTLPPFDSEGTGPGGVGSTDGTSTLELWLRADYLNKYITPALNDGDPVTSWVDSAGHVGLSADYLLPLPATPPIYQTDVFNGQPAVSFTSLSFFDSLQTTANITLDRFSVFSVFNAANPVSSIYYHDIPITADYGQMRPTDSCTIDVQRAGVRSGKNMPANWGADGQMRIATHAYDGTHDGHLLYVNGVIPTDLTDCIVNDPGFTADQKSALPPHAAPIYLGTYASSVPTFFGALPEFIVFSEALSDIQRLLVENYLSAKYDLPLDVAAMALADSDMVSNDDLDVLDIATVDLYDGDTAENGDFDRDMAGIGQLNGAQNSIAHSRGIIIRDNSFLNADGDSLTFGYRTVAPGNSTADLPTAGDWGPGAVRWERHWHIDRRDAGATGGLVDIAFDFSAGGMNLNNNHPLLPVENYRLLQRHGHSGPFTDITAVSGATVAIWGDQVQFFGVNADLLTGNITLGSIDPIDSPTAVTMQTLGIQQSSPTAVWPILVAFLALLSATMILLRRHRLV